MTDRSEPVAGQPGADPSRLSGLTDQEAQIRRERGEGNNVTFASSRTYRQIVRDNALTSINILLFMTGILLVAFALYTDAAVTVGLVALNVLVAIFQEFKSKRVLDRIALLTRPRATVIRNGNEREVDPAELVIGDLIVAEPGDQIVVDGTLVAGRRAILDESLLTGESTPVAKAVGESLSSGSFCVSGRLVYEAERVGAESYANSLTQKARSTRLVKTPVQRDVDLILRVMILLIVVLGGPVVLDLGLRVAAVLLEPVNAATARQMHRAYSNYSVETSVRSAAVIISLVPQGLALMLTVTYALAAVRLSGRNTLLQQANAVESLSHVDVLCLDKTGTLTTNRLIFHNRRAIGIADDELEAILRDYAASVSAPNKTVAALATAFPGKPCSPRLEVPFSSRWKWSGVSLDGDDASFVVVGAPDVLLQSIKSSSAIAEQIDDWSREGLRVVLLACARSVQAIEERDEHPVLPEGLVAIGLVAFQDELQPHVRETLDHFSEAGIGIRIISGDYPETVAALATQAGFEITDEQQLVSGLDLARMDEAAFARAVQHGVIFGRITPDQKVAIVAQFQADGHYVAMIGDGVNDVLALKQSQVGISMESGSQATRAVADMVLLKDSFAALPDAFREGQRIVRGVQDLIKLFLARSLSQVVVILGTGIIGAQFPLIPTHNAIPAFLVIGVPTIGIAAWARPGPAPRRLLRSVTPFAIPAAISIGILCGTLFIAYLRATGDLMLARTVLTSAAVLCGLMLIVFAEPPIRALTGGDELACDWRPTIMAGAMLALFAMLISIPWFRTKFELATLAPTDVAIIGGTVVIWAVALLWAWRFRLLERMLAV